MPNVKTLKEVHNAFCDYEVDKAKSSRIRTVRTTERKPLGIRTSGVSKAMLARELASLLNCKQIAQ